jgi:hypothetical protein
MLGKSFCPRIKNIKDQWLYKINPGKDYGSLNKLLKGQKYIFVPLVGELGHTLADTVYWVETLQQSATYSEAPRACQKVGEVEDVSDFSHSPVTGRKSPCYRAGCKFCTSLEPLEVVGQN